MRTLSLVVAMLAPSGLLAQTPALPAVKPVSPRQTLSVTFGLAVPRSKSGLTAFWENGASGSASFFVNVNREVAIGLGVDVAELQFKESAFRETYPDVDVEANNVILSNVYVGAKLSLLPSMRTCPYITVSMGAQRMTEALYRRSIAGVRVTYYNIGGSTRLTGGVAVGANIHVNSWFALEVEGKATYIHNDPDASVVGAARGGFRFRL